MYANQIFNKARSTTLQFLLLYFILNTQTVRVLSIAMTVISHPKGVTLKVGEDVTLVCKFSSKPPAGCSWELDRQLFAPDGQRIYFVGNTNAGDCTIGIRNVTINDNGRYVCRSPEMGDTNAAQSNPAIVTVIFEPKPPIMIYNGYEVSNGGYIDIKTEVDTIQVQCHIKDGNPPANVTWALTYNSNLQAKTNDKISDINNNLRTTISILDLQINEQLKDQQLKCTALHIAYASGTNSTYAVLKVPSPVTRLEAYIPQIPENMLEVGPEVTVTIVCRADGHPEPSYRWEYRVDDKTDWSPYNENNQNTSVQNQPGEYVCVAKNVLNVNGEIRSNSVVISVKYDDNVNIGAIVGGILAVIVVVAILLGVAIYAYVKRKWCFKMKQMKTTVPDDSIHYMENLQNKNIYNPPSQTFSEINKSYAAPLISAPKPNMTQVPASPAIKKVEVEDTSSEDEAKPAEPSRASLLRSSSSSATSASSSSSSSGV